MIHVTDTPTQVVDTQLSAGARRVSNTGPDPIDISIDPEVVYGEGTRVASGSAAQLDVPTGRRVFAVCDGGNAADVELVASIATSGPHVFEVTDLAIPSGTDWSGSDRHVIGTFSAVPVGGLLVALLLETAELPPDNHLTLSFNVVGWSGGVVGVSTDAARKWVSTVPAYLSDFTAEVGTPTDPVPGSQDFEVKLTTFPPTTADMLVHARAAVLVL